MELILDLHEKQKEIAQNILTSSSKYHIINASRQSGKSHLALSMLIYYCLTETDKEIMFVSPVHKQNKKIFLKLKQILRALKSIDSCDGSDLDIYLKNGNHVQFRSAERYDNIRGESVDILFCDEFSFIRKDAWESAIRPVTAARKSAKVIICSTPKGHNLFYDLAILGMSDDNDRYVYYKMMYWENTYYDIKEVEDAKKTLPENIYKTEYLAEFIADGVVFRDLDIICSLNNYSTKGSRFFAGLDFGQADDYTVLTILNELGECVDIVRTNFKSFSDILKDLMPSLTKYKPIVYVESNNGTINAPLYEALLQKYSNLYPFQTSNTSKADIVESLNLSIDAKIIKLPSKTLMPSLFFEMSTFEYEYSTKTRRIIYGAPRGLHDDIVISVCLANKCYRENKHAINPIFIPSSNEQRW